MAQVVFLDTSVLRAGGRRCKVVHAGYRRLDDTGWAGAGSHNALRPAVPIPEDAA